MNNVNQNEAPLRRESENVSNIQNNESRPPLQNRPIFNFNVRFCAKCNLVIDERISLPNPCCNQQNLCSNCFMKQYKTSDGATQIIPTLIFCSTFGAIFQNPLAYNDFLALYLIQSDFERVVPGFRPQHGSNSPP